MKKETDLQNMTWIFTMTGKNLLLRHRDYRSLNRKLEELAESDLYPFHMPGHKRNLAMGIENAGFSHDITIHHAWVV